MSQQPNSNFNQSQLNQQSQGSVPQNQQQPHQRPASQNGGQPAPQIDLSRLQPAQVQALIHQMNTCHQEAQKLGDTPAGKEQFLKYQRIKMLLQQYQHQTKNANQSKPGTPIQQQQQQQPLPQQSLPQQPLPQSQQQQQMNRPVSTPQQKAQNSQQQIQQQAQIPIKQIQPKNETSEQQFPQRNIQIHQIQPNQQPANMNTNVNRNQNNSPSPGSSVPPNKAVGAQPAMKATPIQQYRQLKEVLPEFVKRLEKIEASKKSGNLPPDQLAKLIEQENTVRNRYNSYRKLKMTLEAQLNITESPSSQQQSPQHSSPQLGLSPVVQPQFQQQQPAQQQQHQSRQLSAPQPQSQQGVNNAMQIAQQQQIQQQKGPIQNSNSQTPKINNGGIQVPSQPQTVQHQPSIPLHQQQQFQQQQQQQQGAVQRKVTQPRINTPQISEQHPEGASPAQVSVPGVPSSTNNRSNVKSQSPITPITNVNAAARPTSNLNATGPISSSNTNVFKTAVPAPVVSQNVTAKPPVASTPSQPRATLSGGSAVGAPSLTTPSLLKLPPYEMQGDRVLSKRKLSELVKTVGADEGDGETTIDGDVEELLLDLADEFVTNVTSFACRLAKHRKCENLQSKDVQLHLEKNYNIRIPGYASDDVRSVRKWVSNSQHGTRVQGIEISKSVEQNK